MNAKTSYFNKKIFIHNITNVLPFLFLMTGIMAAISLSTVSPVLRKYSYEGMSDAQRLILIKNTIYDNGSNSFVKIIMACYSFFCGVSVFRYLYQKKLCQTIHALPIKRAGLFWTNVLSGFAILILPFLCTRLIMGIYLPIKGYGAACSCLPLCFIIMVGFCLIFYALSILASMLTGHLIATPIIYFILNFGIIITELVLRAFISAFFFGMPDDIDPLRHSIWTPFVHLWQTLRLEEAESFTKQVFYQSDGLTALIIYAVVSVVILVLCLYLYQIRKLELQGDPIIFKPLQPIFLYIGVLLGSIALAWLLYEIFHYQSVYISTDMFALVIYFIISSIVLYYLINMLLKKTIHVFRSNYKGIVAFCCIALAAFLLIRLDVFGIETKTPELKDLSSINLYVDGNDFVINDSDSMQKLIDIHKSIIENKESIIQSYKYGITASSKYGEFEYAYPITIQYQMKNGNSFTRNYPILYYSSDQSEETKAVSKIHDQCMQIVSEPELLLHTLETLTQNLYSVDILYPEQMYQTDPEETIAETITDINVYQQDYPKLFHAMELDIRDNNLKPYFYSDPDNNAIYRVSLYAIASDLNSTEFTITDKCKNTLAVIEELIEKQDQDEDFYPEEDY